jgi:hypothetical protein
MLFIFYTTGIQERSALAGSLASMPKLTAGGGGLKQTEDGNGKQRQRMDPRAIMHGLLLSAPPSEASSLASSQQEPRAKSVATSPLAELSLVAK